MKPSSKEDFKRSFVEMHSIKGRSILFGDFPVDNKMAAVLI